jgi:hypothetical protein
MKQFKYNCALEISMVEIDEKNRKFKKGTNIIPLFTFQDPKPKIK